MVHQGLPRGPAHRWRVPPPRVTVVPLHQQSQASATPMADAFGRCSSNAEPETLFVTIPRSMYNQLLKEHSMNNENTAQNQNNDATAGQADPTETLRQQTIAGLDERLLENAAERARLEEQRRLAAGDEPKSEGALKRLKGAGFAKTFGKVAVTIGVMGAAIYGGVYAWRRYSPV